MSEYPHPDLPQDGLILSIEADGAERTFARVEVTGLSYEQMAQLHKHAKAMRRGEIVNHLIGEENCG